MTTALRLMRSAIRLDYAVPAAAAALLAVALAPAAAADDGPIVLTNEDLARVVGKRTETARAEAPARDSGLIRIDPGPAASAAPPSVAAPAANRTAPSWQEEYYRLKAEALRQAMERGERVSFADEDAPEVERAERDPVDLRTSHGAACVYDKGGELIHTPQGARCRSHRDDARPAASASGAARCVFGADGEVLYAPPGRRCE